MPLQVRLCSNRVPGTTCTVDEARLRLLNAVSPLNDSETLTLDDGLGRVLATSIAAAVSSPPADNSAMDGYALSAEELAQAGGELPLSARIHAGDAPSPLVSGSAARIFTGGEIPPGADAVVMQENCVEHDGKLRVNGPFSAGQNIRRAGEDFPAGAEIMHAGRRLQPQDLGLIASGGIDRIEVVRRPRISVLTTGNELIAPGVARRAGQIYNSNGPVVCALLKQLGCVVLPARKIGDTLDATRQALIDAAAESDLVISTGGVSVGESDFVRKALEDIGQLDFWRIAVRPGKPLAFGSVRGTPIIGLPGNPVAVFVTFGLFVAPAIRKLQGRRVPIPEPIQLPAAFSRPETAHEEYLRVRVEDGRLTLYPHQGSGVLSSVVWADGLARIRADQGAAEGRMLDFFHFDTLLK